MEQRPCRIDAGATVQALMSLEKDVFSLLANNAALCLRGNARVSKLSAAEKFRYERLVALQMSMYYSAFVQFGQGLIDAEVWEAYFEALKTHLAQPGFRQTWKGMAKRYPRSFRDITGQG